MNPGRPAMVTIVETRAWLADGLPARLDKRKVITGYPCGNNKKFHLPNEIEG
jgi:hypothetical protein